MKFLLPELQHLFPISFSILLLVSMPKSRGRCAASSEGRTYARNVGCPGNIVTDWSLHPRLCSAFSSAVAASIEWTPRAVGTRSSALSWIASVLRSLQNFRRILWSGFSTKWKISAAQTEDRNRTINAKMILCDGVRLCDSNAMMMT